MRRWRGQGIGRGNEDIGCRQVDKPNDLTTPYAPLPCQSRPSQSRRWRSVRHGRSPSPITYKVAYSVRHGRNLPSVSRRVKRSVRGRRKMEPNPALFSSGMFRVPTVYAASESARPERTERGTIRAEDEEWCSCRAESPTTR